MTRVHPATILAITVVVICPGCGEEQPEPDNGSLAWEINQLPKEPITRGCACGTAFTLKTPTRVHLA